jgi:hypothetical protein
MSGPRVDVGRAFALLLTTGAVLTSAACAGDALTPKAADTTAEQSTATETTEPTTESSSAPTTTEETTSTSSVPGELDPEDVGRRLTLNDFFNPATDWQEDRYDIADQKQVQGIAAEVYSCNSAQELELRLANNFEELDFSVGQANDSRSSDASVTVEVLANNAQVEIRSVPFNEIQEFAIPVEGVNALKIHVSLDDRATCSGDVTAVLTDVTLS